MSPYFVQTNQTQLPLKWMTHLCCWLTRKYRNIRDLLSYLVVVAKSGKPLVIIAEDIEGEALATLVVNTMRGIVKVAAVKAPGFGYRRKAMMQDIAILPCGTLISEEIGLELEKVTLEE